MVPFSHSEDLDAQLEAVANSLADPIFVIDYDGRYIAVLGGQARSKHISSPDLIGRTMQEVLPEEKWRLFLAVVRRAIDTGNLQLCDFQLSCDPGDDPEKKAQSEPQWFQGRVYPVKPQPGRPPSAVWLTINVSEQKRMEEQLKRLSDMDDLTGVYNRRYYLRRLESEFEIARRRSQTLSMIFLDADHFKKINDRYGHVQGDRVLQHLTQTIARHMRSGDILARVGGEEFAILCPATGLPEALALAKRICCMVAATPIQTEHGTIPLTISLGVASLCDCDTVAGQLLRRADQALYKAKDQGRNRACGSTENSSATAVETASA